ncbi:MAG TPA: SRPBCC family protein [Acidimicrobiia bacterium]|nr:SRPBCC family protein [Acidimicrobiia bacterium]
MPTNSTPRAVADDGTIDETDGRYTLRFERRLPHPVDEVWDAITRPERITQWFGEGEIELDLAPGGNFRIRTTGPPELVEAIVAEAGDVALVSHDTVLRVDPPFLFEHTFGSDPRSIARWELQRDGEGTRLTLTHTEPPGFEAVNAPRDLAGWHTVLDRLASVVNGRRVPWATEQWERHRDRYAAALNGA